MHKKDKTWDKVTKKNRYRYGAIRLTQNRNESINSVVYDHAAQKYCFLVCIASRFSRLCPNLMAI